MEYCSATERNKLLIHVMTLYDRVDLKSKPPVLYCRFPPNSCIVSFINTSICWVNSWHTRSVWHPPLLLSGRRALESIRLFLLNPFLQRKNSPACGRSAAFVLWTVLLILCAMSTSTATTPSWNSAGCRPCRARPTSAPASWTSRAATSSLTSLTTSCVCGNTVRLAGRASNRGGGKLGISTKDALTLSGGGVVARGLSGMPCIPEVPASSPPTFLGSPLAQTFLSPPSYKSYVK